MKDLILRLFCLCLFIMALFESHDPDILYCMDPITLGAIILGGTSLVGSAIGSSMTNASNANIASGANEMNYRIFKEQSDFNRQERLETQDFNRKLWYEQQKYNSPVQQAARLRAAGLNPSVALNGETSSAPIASSPASAGSWSGATTYQSQNALDNFGNILSPLSDAMLKKAQTDSIMIDNESASRKNLLELKTYEANLEKLLEDKKLSKARRREIKSSLDTAKLQRGILELEQDKIRFGNQHMEQDWDMFRQKMIDDHNESTYRQAAQNLANEITEATGMKIANAQLSHIYQSIRESSQSVENMKESKKLTHAQMLHEYEKKAETLAKRLGISSQNKHFNSVKNYIKSEMQLAGERSGDTNRMRSDRLARTIDNVNNLFGLGALRGVLK